MGVVPDWGHAFFVLKEHDCVHESVDEKYG